MVLAVDIGNSTISIDVVKERKVTRHYSISSGLNKTSDEYGVLFLNIFKDSELDLKKIKAVMVSSVVPKLTGIITDSILRYIGIKPVVVDIRSNHGLKINIDNPMELGTDRLMTALAAHTKFDTNCITVDFGTATTIEVVKKGGVFSGGIIFPGVKIAAEVLHDKTAKLPEVNIVKPEKIVGTNTIECIQSGIFYGYLSLIDGLIDRIKDEVFNTHEDIKFLATGGMASFFIKESRHNLHHEPHLISFGLYTMYERLL